jgi:uncharacterized membrane protein
MKKRYLFIMLVCVFAFMNALYLSEQAYTFMVLDRAGNSFCDLSSSVSCSTVLQSPYSKVFGIPFPWVALVVYPVLFVLAWVGYRTERRTPARALTILSGAGVLFNLFIMYREIFFIKAFCILCAVCTVIIITIFLVSRSLLKKPL